MRKMALVIAVLVLAGCGEGKEVSARKASTPAISVPATASALAAAPQWHLEVRGETTQAVSDLSGWLIEHGFVSNVVMENGKARILVGPFNSKAEAQARQADLTAALARAKKMNIESLVVEQPSAQ
ncbi:MULTISPECIES: SPOR domain-containing protein [unclassified Pseudomonas]|uniref:SPOR domain-containing protein n=1 Tax=unclassified Pseudomonas TaxID=196821 RepID=UPI002AC979BF|nr:MULTISPECIES: SPOR domain-containing protein [unclassified Pseudomonas]MEB0048428.1 SPOR domain-containing protein [Pseudomonas sp. Dout3]MEB0098012.1 SPOR domain-containing protein [Pseudomonas sp. DC1.2]WPX57038.1 SPOR domain-containing protein [Pseudomonas sp. DC1.2]